MSLGKSSKAVTGRVIGANDKINLGVDRGGRPRQLPRHEFTRYGEKTGASKIVAVCDVYEKRKREHAADVQMRMATSITARC